MSIPLESQRQKIETYLGLIPIGIIIFAAKSGRELGRFCVMIVIQVENEKQPFELNKNYTVRAMFSLGYLEKHWQSDALLFGAFDCIGWLD